MVFETLLEDGEAPCQLGRLGSRGAGRSSRRSCRGIHAGYLALEMAEFRRCGIEAAGERRYACGSLPRGGYQVLLVGAEGPQLPVEAIQAGGNLPVPGRERVASRGCRLLASGRAEQDE
ncbi:MAG: hypothetical protein QOG21_1542 [Actinomycetota bacterium]|nr:hypothetical protein [Actinomycetota bacterium]